MSKTSNKPSPGSSARKITLIVFEGAQLLDVAGPADVFNEANKFIGDSRYDLVYVSSNGGTVRLSCGLPVETKKVGNRQVKELETLIVSGGRAEGLFNAMNDEH